MVSNTIIRDLPLSALEKKRRTSLSHAPFLRKEDSDEPLLGEQVAMRLKEG
jgi:hypothetical protein